MKVLRKLRSVRRFCQQAKNLGQGPRHMPEVEAKQIAAHPNPLRDRMVHQIQAFGEMKIEKYWTTALTDPEHGYYSTKNVFSAAGDFTTSPEISPLFGECIGVWIVHFLIKIKVFDEETSALNKKFRLVELGPGRGLLMRDIVQTFADLKIKNDFDISFVEVSEFNRKAQQQAMMEQFKRHDHFFKFQHQASTNHYQYFSSENPDKNVNLKWFQTLEDLYQQDMELKKKNIQPPLTVFVMNQFFDALPTTVLKYTEKGWREKALQRSLDPEMYFELKPSNATLPEKMLPQIDDPQPGTELEISFLSCLTMDLMAKIVALHGGAIFNVDYGGEGFYSDSIRAIKEHKYVPSPHFWQMPGLCDLSAYVNFYLLGQFAEKNEGIRAYPAITQGNFLTMMGIQMRVDVLKKSMNEEEKKALQSEMDRLVQPEQMGEIYKVQIITRKEYGEIYPHVDPSKRYSF